MLLYSHLIPPNTTFLPSEQEEEKHAPDPTTEISPHQTGGHTRHQIKPPTEPVSSDLLGGALSSVKDLLNGLFQNFSLEHLDSGDILLILIILFLFLEGDNLDLVIALGLMLLLGLGESQPSDS